METECEIAVDLRSDRVVYELPREASILRRGARSAQRRLRSKSRRPNRVARVVRKSAPPQWQ